MTLTPTQRLRGRSPKVNRRKAALRRARATYTDLAKLADVTYSMAWKFMNGERVSAACERAYVKLCGRPTEAK